MERVGEYMRKRTDGLLLEERKWVAMLNQGREKRTGEKPAFPSLGWGRLPLQVLKWSPLEPSEIPELVALQNTKVNIISSLSGHRCKSVFLPVLRSYRSWPQGLPPSCSPCSTFFCSPHSSLLFLLHPVTSLFFSVVWSHPACCARKRGLAATNVILSFWCLPWLITLTPSGSAIIIPAKSRTPFPPSDLNLPSNNENAPSFGVTFLH